MNLIPVETVECEKKDGTSKKQYKAIFTRTMYIIEDMDFDGVPGDILIRHTPNGKCERYVITESTYREGSYSIKAGYHVEIEKEHKFQQTKASTVTNNYNLNSNAGSIQIGDNNTQNIVNYLGQLVDKINNSDVSEQEKTEAKSIIKKLTENPLINTILGAAISSLIAAL